MIISSRIAWVGILFFAAGMSVVADEREREIFSGKFSVPLDAGWSWLREEPKGWMVEDGTLRFRTLPGHIFAKHNDARNVLLRKLPESTKPVAVDVFVECRPQAQFEEATLYWYFDEDHYVGLFKEQLDTMHVRMISESVGKPTFHFNQKYEADGVWFRLVIVGGKATGYFRPTDREPWQKMAQVNLPAQGEAKVALIASGGPEKSDRWAGFRDFRILELGE